MNKKDSSIKVQFGERLKLYRESIELTQNEYAKMISSEQSTITDIELGKHNTGIEMIERIAKSFGVTYYEFGNPNFRIPPLKKMPKALQDYLIQVKQDRKIRKKQPRIKLAPYLDNLLGTKFLKTPHTAAEIAIAIKKAEGVIAEPGKITALLTKHPRNKIVRTIPGEEWGGGMNKYVLV
ncbi:DNA-binding transcriptional regulator, XRE-family HTH domain [bacterium A37T11]|nr:DNA-binding transcriptional regulator, XRE-family HTH domain [bacterium A37T11]